MVRNKKIWLYGAIIGFLMGFIPQAILHFSLYLGQGIFYFGEFIKSIYFGIFFLIIVLFPIYYYYRGDTKTFKYLAYILAVVFILFVIYNFFIFYTYYQINAFGSIVDAK